MIATVTAADVHGPERDVRNDVYAVFDPCGRHHVNVVFHAHPDSISPDQDGYFP